MALAFCILAVTVSAASAECDCASEIGGSPPFQITKVEHLKQLSACVDKNNDHTDITFELTTDIDLNNENWTPIGSWHFTGSSNNRPFSGTFDGNNKTISGLEINRVETTAASLGLFGYVGPGGTVKDLNVVEGTVKGVSADGNSSFGGVVGHNAGNVEGCSFSGSVEGGINVGGVVGYNLGTARVTNCYNSGDVTGNNSGGGGSIGGVVGLNGGTVTKCYNTGPVTGVRASTGGVVGFNNSGTVSECYNTGDVKGPQYASGVVGYSASGSSVVNCYNTGHVTSLKGVSDHETLPARGGVVGYNVGTVQNSYSLCEVIGNFRVGGIVGNNTGTVQNCVSLTWMVDGNGPDVGGETSPNIDTNVGRVVGLGDVGLSGNKARSDMELSIRGVDEAGGLTEDEKTATTRHGEDVYTYFDKSEPPSNQKEDVFVDWNEDVWEFRDESLTQNARLPILVSLKGVGSYVQNPQLPAHPSPGQPGDDDGGCGCDAGGFTAPGLLALAFVMGMKRLRRPRG